MNTKDEFFYWVSMAISEPNESNRYYYFNVVRNELFGVIKEQNTISPIFRNLTTKNNTKVLNSFKINFHQKLCNSNDILLLPRLSLAEKIKFLLHFAQNLSDCELKEQLIYETSLLTEQDAFTFKISLQEYERDNFFDFEFKRGIFLASKVKEMFMPLGVTENSVVVW